MEEIAKIRMLLFGEVAATNCAFCGATTQSCFVCPLHAAQVGSKETNSRCKIALTVVQVLICGPNVGSFRLNLERLYHQSPH